MILKPGYLLSFLNPIASLGLKSAFFIFYLQIFGSPRWLRIYTWIGLAVTVVSQLIFAIILLAYATPGKGKTFISQELTSNVLKIENVSVPQYSIGLAIDLYILSTPLMGVYRLQMSPKSKTGVLIILLSGFL
jgi:hypothetical protein